MDQLLKLICIWGMLDGVWLTLDPSSWSSFWGRFIGAAGRRRNWPRAFGLVELGLSLYMLRRGR